MGRAFALRTTDLGLIPGIFYGSRALPGEIPKHRAGLTPEHCQVWQNKQLH